MFRIIRSLFIVFRVGYGSGCERYPRGHYSIAEAIAKRVFMESSNIHAEICRGVKTFTVFRHTEGHVSKWKIVRTITKCLHRNRDVLVIAIWSIDVYTCMLSMTELELNRVSRIYAAIVG